MATIITKAQIATMLGVATATIDDNIYSWALAQFYALTNLSVAGVSKTYKKHVLNTTTMFQLAKDVSTITSIKVDNIAQTLVANTDYYLNSETGNIKLTNGVSGYIEIAYTTSALVATDIYSYLISLLTYKGMYIFNPSITNSIKSITIGKYSKSYAVSSNFLEDLEVEIMRARDLAIGDSEGLNYGGIY